MHHITLLQQIFFSRFCCYDMAAIKSQAIEIVDVFLSSWVNESDREARYLYDDLTDEIQEIANVKKRTFLSGSKAEGMRNAGDKDMMMITPEYIVVEKIDQIPKHSKQGVLIFDMEDCYPGFTRLKLHTRYMKEGSNDSQITDKVNSELFDEIDGKSYLNRLKYLKFAYTQDIDGEKDSSHGPALLVGEGSEDRSTADLVTCLEVPIWPQSALNMTTRNQNKALQKVLNKVTQNSCHVVAVPHPLNQGSEYEFRISFSYAEKFLIRKWSNQQIKLYFLTKDLFGRFFNVENGELEKGLCSYFAKTIIFWMIEENDGEFWKSQSILELVETFFGILRNYLTYKSCPNYFIRENHMMSAYTDSQINKLINRLDTITSDMLLTLLKSRVFKAMAGTNWETIISLYQITEMLAIESIGTEIFQGILEYYKAAKPDISLMIRGFYKSYLTEFMSYCQFSSWCVQSYPFEVLYKTLDSYNKFTEKYDSKICSHFFKCMTRSAVHCGLQGFSTLSDKDRKGSYAIILEDLLIETMEYNDTEDCKLTGNVYLGILYMTCGALNKAIYHLDCAIQTYYELCKERKCYWLFCLPVVMTSHMLYEDENYSAPSFIDDDEILRDIFEIRHLHSVAFDPLVLGTYLKYTITNQTEDLLLFSELDQLSYDLKPEILPPPPGSIKFTTKESYQYMKYRLGLYEMESELYKSYSHTPPIQCALCENGGNREILAKRKEMKRKQTRT